VYVGGVPHEWDEGALASLFAGVGTVTNLAFGPAKSPIGKTRRPASPPGGGDGGRPRGGGRLDWAGWGGAWEGLGWIEVACALPTRLCVPTAFRMPRGHTCNPPAYF